MRQLGRLAASDAVKANITRLKNDGGVDFVLAAVDSSCFPGEKESDRRGSVLVDLAHIH